LINPKALSSGFELSQKNTDELWRWSAAELAYAIRTKQISSREAVMSCLKRIEEVNPKVNALVEVLAEGALRAADASDRSVLKGEELGPLHGVPVATKINTDQAGHVTTDGVVAFQHNVATDDSPPVAHLRKAGTVFVGRSNVPSFSLRWVSNNDLHGSTLNPWDPTRTPGGSSGGAASAVACGMAPIAQGNDIGGSIRYPAYACGITGIRPTIGRVATGVNLPNGDPPLSLQMKVTEGPLARNVADLRLALSVMSAYDPSDPVHANVPLTGEPLKKQIRVGLLRDPGVVKPDPAVNQALNEAAAYLNDAGYVVEEVDLPLFAEAYKLWYLLVLEDLTDLWPAIKQFGDEGARLNLQYNYEVSRQWWGEVTLEKYRTGYARRGTLIIALQKFMEQYPILLLPVSAEQAFKQNEDIESVDSNARLMAAQWPMMSIALLGFPAISVPTSVSGGLPAGVQIVGRRFREDTILDAAEIIESRANIQVPIDPLFH